jgi:pimeloyl-ACP methyl ester carboxylesterase
MADQQCHRWRFDIPLLGKRLTGAVEWLIQERLPKGASLGSVGLFGSSTGVAAALITAAARPDDIQAVVRRGGRPDLAFEALPQVRCPTLLIVGEEDREVVALNQQSIAAMTAPHRLAVVPAPAIFLPNPGP